VADTLWGKGCCGLFVSELELLFVCEEDVIEDGDESWGKEVAV
jgi:hypothetical protein